MSYYGKRCSGMTKQKTEKPQKSDHDTVLGGQVYTETYTAKHIHTYTS